MQDEEWQSWEQREERKWRGYEAEKNKLKQLNLSPEEYEARLQTVISRLGV